MEIANLSLDNNLNICSRWWAHQDLNLGPIDYEEGAGVRLKHRRSEYRKSNYFKPVGKCRADI